jgi:membrane-bound ClpP family serine protease
MCCKKCMGFFGMFVLIVGVLFLLRDLNVWHFWNIQGWTVVFLLAGLLMFFSSGCHECNVECKTKEETKKPLIKKKK